MAQVGRRRVVVVDLDELAVPQPMARVVVDLVEDHVEPAVNRGWQSTWLDPGKGTAKRLLAAMIQYVAVRYDDAVEIPM